MALGANNSGGAPLGGEVRPVSFEVNQGQTDLEVRFRPLVTDPALPYSSHLGGAQADGGTSIAVDASGSAYITGWTRSADFPKKNPTQNAFAGGNATEECLRGARADECGDAFVAKLNPEGSGFVYTTYLGGSGSDVGTGIAVDSSGAAYVTGWTRSPDFPTKNAFLKAQGQFSERGRDAFVTKLDPTGAIAYSTYLGSVIEAAGTAIAVDAGNKAYVTGSVTSSMPVKNPILPVTGGAGSNAFVAKFDPALAGQDSLVYATHLGGAGDDGGSGIAVDSDGSAYVTGNAGKGFPTKDPLPTVGGGGSDAFVTKLSPEGSSLVYSTLLGGTQADAGTGIAVDSSGRAHVTGTTASPDFPTKKPLEAAKKGRSDAFVAVLDAKGSSLSWSSYLGGADAEGGGIALHSSGVAYLAGTTRADLPTKDPLQGTRKGRSDAFVVKVDFSKPGQGSVLYSTYLGGSAGERAAGVAVDSRGAAYLTGSTDSPDGFPIVGPLQPALAGSADGFVAKLGEVPEGYPGVTGLSPSGGPISGGTIVTLTGTGFGDATAVRFGRVAAAAHSVSSNGTKITVRAPAQPDGTVVVTVVNKKGLSSPVPAANFTYSDGGWLRIAGPARFNHAVAMLADGRVLVAGGCLKGAPNGTCAEPTDTAEIYDPVTRKWTPTARMTTARPAGAPSTVNHTATLLPDGRVLVVGGNTAELYDPVKKVWSPTAAPVGRFAHSATLLHDGKVLRIDDREGQSELYDPTAGTWTSVGSSTDAKRRLDHTATLLPSGKVLVVAGSLAQVFDPATATWAETAEPEIVRDYHSATVLPDGKVLLVGGLDSNGQALETTEIYDPEVPPDPARPEVKGAWVAGRSLTVGRYAHTAMLLPSGKVLVVGGSFGFGTRIAGGELYDPATGRWKPAGDMSTGRGGSLPVDLMADDVRGGPSFTATLLKDGNLLVVGGSDAAVRDGVTSALDSAELYGSAGNVAVPSDDDGGGEASTTFRWPVAGGGVLLAAGVALVLRRRKG